MAAIHGRIDNGSPSSSAAQFNEVLSVIVARRRDKTLYVGFRLVTEAGPKGIVNLTKLVQVEGGIVGGAFDLVACQAVGRIAKNVFRPFAEPGPLNDSGEQIGGDQADA